MVLELKVSEKLCILFAREITFLASAMTSRWLDINGWIALWRDIPELSLRTPEKTSMQWAVGFNKTKVSRFFELLEKQLFNENGSRKISAQNMYNIDETGVTICQKPQKIVDKKGQKALMCWQVLKKGKTLLSSAIFLLLEHMYHHSSYILNSSEN